MIICYGYQYPGGALEGRGPYKKLVLHQIHTNKLKQKTFDETFQYN